MSKVLLNVECVENDGIYSIILGDKVVELDTETFKQLQVTTYETNNKSTYNKAFEMEYEQQWKDFFEENPNFYIECNKPYNNEW